MEALMATPDVIWNFALGRKHLGWVARAGAEAIDKWRASVLELIALLKLGAVF